MKFNSAGFSKRVYGIAGDQMHEILINVLISGQTSCYELIHWLDVLCLYLSIGPFIQVKEFFMTVIIFERIWQS